MVEKAELIDAAFFRVYTKASRPKHLQAILVALRGIVDFALPLHDSRLRHTIMTTRRAPKWHF